MNNCKFYFCCLPKHIVMGIVGSVAIATLPFSQSTVALPPPEDTPEEILRTEIILEARSPVDGEPLTASEYVELQQDLAESDDPPSLNAETQHLIFILQIRKFLNIVSPFQIM